jgi:tetratricopeptide (TPR) repeat protein
MLESGSPERALASVDRFLSIEPRRTDAHETRARILLRLSRLVESEKAFSKAIALSDRPTPDLYLARHEAILARGPEFRSLALKKLDEGISRIGSIVTLELEAVDLERSMQNWNGALQRLERLSSLSPRKEIWLFRRGDILIEAGRHGEAREAYAQALRAIESLPQRNRASAATKQLEAQARQHLQETSRHGNYK